MMTNTKPSHRSRRIVSGIAAMLALCSFLTLCVLPGGLQAGAFISNSEAVPDTITHPRGYDGTGGELEVSVCIDPASLFPDEMEGTLLNVIDSWNALIPTTGNLLFGEDNDIADDEVDWESTILHEIGHCIGLAHPNAASESGLPGADANYTKAADGPNNVFDIAPGVDGIRGSGDDVRGDDINLHWYNNDMNDPFTLLGTVDGSTYSVALDNLPGGELFATNADRDVATLFGVPDTEASMQQGAFLDEDQRSLVADDIATLQLGMAGLDEVAGTADDYTVLLTYAGVTTSCDLIVRLIDTGSFAFCSFSTSVLAGNHRVINASSVTTGNFNWFFTEGPAIFVDGFESGDTTAWQ